MVAEALECRCLIEEHQTALLILVSVTWECGRGSSLLKKISLIVNRTFSQVHKENMFVTCFSIQHGATSLDVFSSLKTEDKAKRETSL